MADNTTLDAGSGGDTIRTDEIAGVKWPCDKIAFGADGSATLVDGSGNGLPILLKNSSGTEIGTNAAPVQVGDAGGSLTVDGTVAATQSGTWTVQPGNTPNTTAWKVDGSAVTQPVSASSLPLPSGASTAAKQPALGTAGTASADVITIQGVASMTPVAVSDNSGSLTVDGTVTANLAAGTNNIGDVDVLSVPAPLSTTGGGTEATALRVTLANDSTGVVSVDDNGGSLTVDGTVGISGTVTVGSHAVTNAGTFAVQVDGTALTRLTDIETNTDSGAVIGNGAAATAQRVTLANDSTGIVALTTSTASIGKLAANSGVDIGDVDVTSVVPGTGATNLGKAEDAAHSSGDTGVMALGVRQDSQAAFGADGDYAPLSLNSVGALRVTSSDTVVDSGNSTTTPLAGSATFTGTGVDLLGYSGITVAVLASHGSTANGMRFEFSSDNSNWDINVGGGFDYVASTGRQFQFNCQARYFRVRFTNDGTPQTSFRLQTLLHRQPVTLTTIHRLDANVAIDRSASLVKSAIVAQINGTGEFTPIQASAAGILKIGGSVDVTSVVPGTAASDLGKAEDAPHVSGNVGVMALSVRQDTAAALAGTDADYQPLITDGSGRLHVNVGNTVTVGSHAVTNAGTFAVQVDGTALTRLTDIETNTDSGAVVGGGTEATAQRVTIANDSTGVLSVDDNGGSLTIDAASLPLPTGASTAAKQPALGTAGTASSDVITVQGIASMTPLQVADNGGSLTVDGTVTANLAAGTNNIGDVDVLTVPAPLSTTGGGTEATALRVTIASDSTGVLSVDDNGSSLTVDNGGTFAVQSADRNGVVIRPSITTSASPDYSANDVVSGIVTLSSVMSASGRAAVLKSLVVKDASGQAPALSFMFFRATPSGGTYTDNAALVWGTNDLSNMTGVVRVLTSDWYTLVSKSLAAFGGLDQLMGSATSDLYMLIVADATWNAASTSDLTVELAFEQR